MHLHRLLTAFLSATLMLCTLEARGETSELSLREARLLAVKGDPWAESSELREQSFIDQGEARAQLPDPRIKLMAGNLPVDSWSLSQEGMTQMSVGIQQKLPRGDSLDLARQTSNKHADAERWQRHNRRLVVERDVTELWLAVYRAQHTLSLLHDFEPLVSELQSLAHAKFRSGSENVGHTNLVQAELELTRLQDRLTATQQRRDVAQQRLAEWVGLAAYRPVTSNSAESQIAPHESLRQLLTTPTFPDNQTLYERVLDHPQLRAIDANIAAAHIGTNIAEQQYKTEWALEASYGYRADTSTGMDRADLFSFGVSFDVPLFTADKQDRNVRASKARAESIRTDQQLVVRDLVTRMRAALVDWRGLNERKALYEQRLLPQLTQQADATMADYANDQGELQDVIRARIAMIDAHIELLTIAVAQHSSVAELNYLSGYTQTQALPSEDL